MCCTPHQSHAHGHAGAHAFGCCMPSHPMPFMWSKKKTINALEKHLEDLREEIKDVEEQLAEFKKEK